MDDKQISKFLSLVLRHKPEVLGITLDDAGYVSVKTLISTLRQKKWSYFTQQDLDRVVQNNDKQRFAYDETRQHIRASQGHSIDIDLGLEPTVPPELLFHGTVNDVLTAIKKQGLQKRARQHVHLSKDLETARTVGKRRGKPVILTVLAGQMHRDGYQFFVSANGVWLTEEVPAQYIDFSQTIFS